MTFPYHMRKELVQVAHQRGGQATPASNPSFLIFTKADTMIRIRRRSYSVEPFTILLLPPHTAYEFEYGTGCEYYMLSVDLPPSDDPAVREVQFLLAAMNQEHFFLFHAESPVERTVISYMLEQLWQLAYQPSEVDPMHRQKADAAVHYLLLLLYDLQKRHDDLIVGKDLKRLSACILQYLEENYASPLTLEQLEKTLLFSKFHLCRVFKKEYGISVFQMLERIRLSAAKNTMEHTNASLLQVSAQCGFSSYSRFYAAFVRRYGQPPSACRHRKNGAEMPL